MANLADVCKEQEMTNWLKALLAINIAKDGLQKFVDAEMEAFKNNIYQIVRSNNNLSPTAVCTSCSIANIISCPIKGLCQRTGNKCRTVHTNPTKQYRPCPNRICDGIRDEIIKAHRFKGPSWKNTSAEQWTSNHWDVAKCFMPPDGYTDVSSIQNTDFNGLISVMLNCTHFDCKMSFSISPPLPRNAPPLPPPQYASTTCLLTKARELCKELRHSSDLRVTSTKLNEYFVTLCGLLSDSLVLANDSAALAAVKKLNELRNDRSNISVPEMCQLLKASVELLRESKEVSEEAKSELQVAISNLLEMKKRLEELETRVKELETRVSLTPPLRHGIIHYIWKSWQTYFNFVLKHITDFFYKFYKLLKGSIKVTKSQHALNGTH